eukprot:gb/GECH01000280.1/.p1 GENE.gb/GECH01000280.1/~~gb/GECH01000280.1/.p1  ORF type:complete len:603 (+),score=136.49 gb/GECH01000280.1/:1-1809(+)
MADGTFWDKFGAPTSSINDIISPDTPLADVLAHEDLLSEVAAGNDKLVQYLIARIDDLVDMICSRSASSSVHDPQEFNTLYFATEVFRCSNQHIQGAVTANHRLLHRILSYPVQHADQHHSPSPTDTCCVRVLHALLDDLSVGSSTVQAIHSDPQCARGVVDAVWMDGMPDVLSLLVSASPAFWLSSDIDILRRLVRMFGQRSAAKQLRIAAATALIELMDHDDLRAAFTTEPVVDEAVNASMWGEHGCDDSGIMFLVWCAQNISDAPLPMIRALVPHLGEVLQTAPTELVTTSAGPVSHPVGQHRLDVMQLLAAVLEQDEALSQVCDVLAGYTDGLNAITDIVFDHPFVGIGHSYYLQILKRAVSAESPALRNVMLSPALSRRVMEFFHTNTDQGTNTQHPSAPPQEARSFASAVGRIIHEHADPTGLPDGWTDLVRTHLQPRWDAASGYLYSEPPIHLAGTLHMDQVDEVGTAASSSGPERQVITVGGSTIDAEDDEEGKGEDVDVLAGRAWGASKVDGDGFEDDDDDDWAAFDDIAASTPNPATAATPQDNVNNDNNTNDSSEYTTKTSNSNRDVAACGDNSNTTGFEEDEDWAAFEDF